MCLDLQMGEKVVLVTLNILIFLHTEYLFILKLGSPNTRYKQNFFHSFLIFLKTNAILVMVLPSLVVLA